MPGLSLEKKRKFFIFEEERLVGRKVAIKILSTMRYPKKDPKIITLAKIIKKGI
jgi:hypothetical protein